MKKSGEENKNSRTLFIDGKMIEFYEWMNKTSIDAAIILREWAVQIMDMFNTKYIEVVISGDSVSFSLVSKTGKRLITKEFEKEIDTVLNEMASLQGMKSNKFINKDRTALSILFLLWEELSPEKR